VLKKNVKLMSLITGYVTDSKGKFKKVIVKNLQRTKQQVSRIERQVRRILTIGKGGTYKRGRWFR